MEDEVKKSLEHFPTSESAQRMLSDVSPIYGYSYVGKWLFQVMGMEWDEAAKIIESLKDQCYLERVTWGMRYWEERYGIEVDESLDLEYRRSRIKHAGTRYGAISPANLERLISEFSGMTVHITEDNPHYCFDIEFEESDTKFDYRVIIEKINSVKPSHLSYRIIFPRQFDLELYHGVAVTQRRIITDTVCLESGVKDLPWMCDENGSVICDEDGNVILDSENPVLANVKVTVYFVANESSGYLGPNTTAELLNRYNTVDEMYLAVSDATVMTDGAIGLTRKASTYNSVSQTFSVQNLFDLIQDFLSVYDVYEADYNHPVGVFYANSKTTAGSLSGSNLTLSDLHRASENEIAVLLAELS